MYEFLSYVSHVLEKPWPLGVCVEGWHDIHCNRCEADCNQYHCPFFYTVECSCTSYTSNTHAHTHTHTHTHTRTRTTHTHTPHNMQSLTQALSLSLSFSLSLSLSICRSLHTCTYPLSAFPTRSVCRYAPFELMKTQLQVGNHRTTMGCVKELRQYGLRGLYMGYVPLVTAHVSGTVMFFVCYGELQVCVHGEM